MLPVPGIYIALLMSILSKKEVKIQSTGITIQLVKTYLAMLDSKIFFNEEVVWRKRK